MNYTYRIFTKAVSEQYCDFISNELATKFPEQQGTTGTTKEEIEKSAEKRKSRIRWVHPRQDTRELFAFFNSMLDNINRKTYGFDLSLGVEPFQYTEYHGDENGHYSWHMDCHYGHQLSDRKLSMSLQLSHPEEYEGGQFCINKHATGPDLTDPAIFAPKGSVIVFPSYIEHCVTPVTKGIRKSLVGWWNGPSYR
jgi:PKHD-type hydroxylase